MWVIRKGGFKKTRFSSSQSWKYWKQYCKSSRWKFMPFLNILSLFCQSFSDTTRNTNSQKQKYNNSNSDSGSGTSVISNVLFESSKAPSCVDFGRIVHGSLSTSRGVGFTTGVRHIFCKNQKSFVIWGELALSFPY